MRILLDECVPRPLQEELPGHDVRTVQEMGWAGKKNGELLSVMAGAGFDVLLTVDRRLRYQQNLTRTPVAVIVLVAASNRLSDLTPLMSSTQAAFGSISPADVVEICEPEY